MNKKGEPAPSLDLRDALPLSAAPERTQVEIPPLVGHYIDGTWVEGLESSRFDCVEPATGEVLTQVAAAGSEEVDQAVAAARKAFDGPWRRMPAAERGKVLFRVARRIQEEARQLAVLESRDNGKPIRESRDVDVPLAAAHFFYYAGWADKLAYAVPGPTPAPVGVCAQIIPWNFPLLMAAWKLAPALAAGNTCVLKPAETTPLTAMRLARILEDAGCPAGVVNIVNGAGDTGAALADHAGIHKLAFTGSTAVGRTLTRNAAGRDQRLTMELGGKGASIVFADAALDQAVEGVVDGIFFNQGQVCCAGSRLLVEESIAADFVQRLQRRMETLRVGHPLDKNTDVGAVNSAEQHARIERYLQLGRDQGATVWQGGACEPPEGGWYVRPTLLLDVQQTDTVVREEIFGPVLAVMTFRTPDEAVRKANDTEYGLAASVWTEKASKLFTVAHALRSGVVWANGANLFDPAAPFGGMRHSGFGREGGIAGLWPYLRAA